ncbi:MAG TPA: hypothetical protein VF596_16275 [Pyrinomonadaceae bacterium]|jgi:hypothetical protein
MSHPQNDNYEESINEYKQESEAMKAANRLPAYEHKLNEINEITNMLGDLAHAFAGKGIDYQREFSANTRTDLAKILIVDELNFQFGRE